MPVAILGSAIFDVDNVDVHTVTFGVTGFDATPVHNGHIGDVDGDGIDDLVLHFREGELGIDPSTAGNTILTLTLTGQISGSDFTGEDTARITPDNSRSRNKGGKGPK